MCLYTAIAPGVNLNFVVWVCAAGLDQRGRGNNLTGRSEKELTI